MKFIEFLKKIQEEGESVAPTNSAGSGKVAGIGVGPQGEPGRRAVLLSKPIKRRQLNVKSK